MHGIYCMWYKTEPYTSVICVTHSIAFKPRELKTRKIRMEKSVFDANLKLVKTAWIQQLVGGYLHMRV